MVQQSPDSQENPSVTSIPKNASEINESGEAACPPTSDRSVSAQKIRSGFRTKGRSYSFFSTPGNFTIEPERWDYDDIVNKRDTILSYYCNGPDPFDPHFSYKRAVRIYLRKRFPEDEAIRNIIDQTTSTFNRNNRIFSILKKLTLLVVACLAFGIAFSVGGEINFQTASIASLSALIVSFVLHLLLIDNLYQSIRDTSQKFHSAFQQFSNQIYNYFKEGFHKIDHAEHTFAPCEWPKVAKWGTIFALWQSKRVEYSEKYLMQSLHTAQHGFVGLFGIEIFGNLISLLWIFVLPAIALITIPALITGEANVAVSDVWRLWQLALAPILLVFAIPATQQYAPPEIASRLAIKAIGLISRVAIWGFIVAVGIIDSAIVIAPLIGIEVQNGLTSFIDLTGFVFLNTMALVLMSFSFSTDLKIIEESVDPTKWRKAETFSIHDELGDQVYRDKSRIIDEKSRQKPESR